LSKFASTNPEGTQFEDCITYVGFSRPEMRPKCIRACKLRGC